MQKRERCLRHHSPAKSRTRRSCRSSALHYPPSRLKATSQYHLIPTASIFNLCGTPAQPVRKPCSIPTGSMLNLDGLGGQMQRRTQLFLRASHSASTIMENRSSKDRFLTSGASICRRYSADITDSRIPESFSVVWYSSMPTTSQVIRSAADVFMPWQRR